MYNSITLFIHNEYVYDNSVVNKEIIFIIRLQKMEEIDLATCDYLVLKLTPQEYDNLVHYVEKYDYILRTVRDKRTNKYKPFKTPRRSKPDLTIHEVIKDGIIYDIQYDETAQ